ncbi:hypothetical protein [Desulfoplanes sp.]
MDISNDLNVIPVDDALFAEAYAALDPSRRSVLKKWIARFHLYWGRDRVEERSETIHWDQGSATTSVTKPLDWSLVVLSETFASPAQLLALIMPMLLSGTKHVYVVRETTGAVSFPVPLLVAMELAGQENVFAAAAGELPGLVGTFWRGHGSRGKIFCLGAPALESLAKDGSFGMDVWSPGAEQRAGVWVDPDVRSWDWETLAWTLEGTRVHVGGADPGNLPDHFTRRGASLKDFMRCDFGALYLPRTHDFSRIPLVPTFGPGQEGGWLWPGITPGTFSTTTVIWHGNDPEHDEERHGRT